MEGGRAAAGVVAEAGARGGRRGAGQPSDGHVLIRSEAQWKAISSPVRFELIEHMHSLTPCSLAELAASVGRRADGLYHHARVLEGAGILRVAGYRKRGKQIEAVYELPGGRVELDIDLATGRHATEFLRVARALMRFAERKLADAVAERLEVGAGVDRRLWARSESTWLDAGRLRRVNRHLMEVQRLLVEGRERRAGRLYHAMVFLLPMAEGHGRARLRPGVTRRKRST